MKKKLIGFSYNKKEWKILSTLGEGKYTFISDKFEKCIIFENDVVGILQINDDSFFITCKSSDDENLYVLYRIKITKYSPIIVKRIKFSDYQFVTDDIILFNNRRFYSISNDGDIMTLCFLAGKNIEIFKKSKNSKKSVIIIKEQISETDFVGVAIDPETFLPVLTAYSSLRDQLIKLTDNFTFDDLVLEDKHYANLINSFFKSSSLDKTDFVLQNMYFN